MPSKNQVHINFFAISENLDDTVFVGRVVLQMLLFFGDLLGSAASIMNVLGSDSNLSTYLVL